MKPIKLTFRVVTDLHLSTSEKDFTSKPKHEGVSFALETSKNIVKEHYFDSDGQTNAAGRKTTQTVLIQGLMGVLKLRAEKDGLDLEQIIYETMGEIKKWAEREATFEASKLEGL